MAMEEAVVLSTSSQQHFNTEKKSNICEECGLNSSKYTCPCCSIRSCSLPCVKSHKKRTSCTGKRHRTRFIPLSQFDDNLLISDYNLLEEAKRVAESAKRRMRDGKFGRFQCKLPFKLQSLKNAAARRKTHIIFLPIGMSKREKNQTRYDHRKNSIFWTIEWRFHSTDVVLIDNWVDENQSLCSVIDKHLKPGPWSNKLKPFLKQQLGSLKFFIRKNAKGNKSPFRELDVKTPLIQQLANTIVLEYPVIHVFPPSASHDFEIVNDMDQSSQKSETKESVGDDLPSPKGVLFREEEVEDDISDPHIIDLLKCMNPELADKSRFANALKPSAKELQEPNIDDCEGFDWNELGVAEGFNLNFEQDLRDAFSGCIDEFNPDEFLDFGGFINEELTIAEELEEGEIPAL